MKSWMIGALLLCAAVLGEAYAEDADECRMLLSMLGIGPTVKSH